MTESDNMAGSDKKQQKMTSGELVAGENTPFLVEDPNVAHFVIPGDPPGLISRANLNADQKTTLNTWANPIVRTEVFRLKIAREGSSEWEVLKEHSLVGPVSPWVPLEFTIPSTFLLDTTHEGPFDLVYEHENAGGVTDQSNRVRIHIDKVPPNGSIPPAKLGFAFTSPITDATFGADDFIEATVPAWTGGNADVEVAFAWLKGDLPTDPADIEMIGPVPIAPGGKVSIPKNRFIEAGDGLCTGGY